MKRTLTYRERFLETGEDCKGIDPVNVDNRLFIEGTPCRLAEDGMFVDLGGKFDGFCPISEIGDACLNQRVLFMQTAQTGEEGIPELSRRKAQTWEAICPYILEQTVLFAKPIKLFYPKRSETPKLQVAIDELKGVQIELPAWEVRGRVEDLIGPNAPQLVPVVIKSIAPTRGEEGKVIVSCKKVNIENRPEQLDAIRTGRVVEGRVLKFLKTSAADPDSSAFVVLNNGAVALLHHKEVAGYPERKVEQILSIGDKIKVAAYKKNKLAVTMRFSNLRSRLKAFQPGTIVAAKILKESAGIYTIELAEGVFGKLFPEDQIIKNNQPEALLKGDTVKVLVLRCSPRDLVVRLGRKQVPMQLRSIERA